MKNLFKRIRSWYCKNRRYSNFKFMLFYVAWLPFLLAVMLHSGHTNFDAWIIFAFNVCIGISFAKDWRYEVNMHEYIEFVSHEVEHLFEMCETTADKLIEEHYRLVAANRRRKRAERKLKWYRNTLRKESADRLGFELQCVEYEAVLLDANLAMADLGSCPIIPDTKAMAEAQQRFNKYMKFHYAEIAKRQLNRQLKESAFGCLFYGDANGEPKDVYAGVFCGEESPFNPSKEIEENQEQ